MNARRREETRGDANLERVKLVPPFANTLSITPLENANPFEAHLSLYIRVNSRLFAV